MLILHLTNFAAHVSEGRKERAQGCSAVGRKKRVRCSITKGGKNGPRAAWPKAASPKAERNRPKAFREIIQWQPGWQEMNQTLSRTTYVYAYVSAYDTLVHILLGVL